MTDTKGESIYHTLEEFFKEKEIPMCNILSVATDGAPAMVGCHRGCIAYLKKNCTKCTRCTLCHSSTTFSCQKFE